MKKVIVYGSPLCPGCVEAKAYLTNKGVDFIYQDISNDLGALKRFLKIRDTSSLYDLSREKGAIGIPTIIVDEEITVGFEEEKMEELLK